ncbi:Iron complex outermembrane recepter protein [Ignavibacterium album JCM 16511]|uniref:Iron complex outermembrane recepter protein n=1 Tax=Ignavibacterium album (strain DSM 19864 / JCM 16511 / NBRC 101810 / Mat9-16) TaxID=945713 RepID=I0ALZ6_IGNAJ|nr:TonB-dependent receptor [Ignavibacterium album]AFH50003.1 Iron complex outermembrane recepter protein [Ignavibacterium album JCM 16511]
MIKYFFGLLLATSFLFNDKLYCQSNDSLNTYSLDNIVVTATKFEIDARYSPNRIEIITSNQINNSNGNRLADILNNSPAVYIKSYGSTASLKTISLNGLGAEHTLILINGVKINSFQNGQIDLSLIPKENIERIEIANNGISSIYGSEAVGGVVNIITKNSNHNLFDNTINVTGNAGYGSFNTSRFGVSLSSRTDEFNFGVYYSNEKSDGNFDYYFNNGLERILKKRENAAYNLQDAGINSQLIFNSKNRLIFYSAYSFQNKQVPGIETGTPPSKTEQKDKNWNNIISLENYFTERLILKTNFNFQNNLMNYEIKPVIQSYYKNLVTSISPELNIKLSDYDILTGYSFTYADLKSNEVENKSRRYQHALFISGSNYVINDLKLFASFRVDHFSDLKKNAFTSRLGFNFKPLEKIALNLRANVGNNFRAPTFNDLYWKESGNPNLKPERSFNFETGFLGLFELLIPIQFDFSFTYINAKDKIIWLPQRNFLWSPVNVGSSETKNFLLNLSYNQKISEQLELRFNSGINFINSKKTNESFQGDPTKDKYFPYLPLQSIKLGVMIDYKNFGIHLFYTHTGKRFSDFENKKSMNQFNILDGNITFDLSMLGTKTSLKFEVNNITNTDYQTISGYPMPLRNYFITLSINY